VCVYIHNRFRPPSVPRLQSLCRYQIVDLEKRQYSSAANYMTTSNDILEKIAAIYIYIYIHVEEKQKEKEQARDKSKNFFKGFSTWEEMM